jgi:hypothetical protein
MADFSSFDTDQVFGSVSPQSNQGSGFIADFHAFGIQQR